MNVKQFNSYLTSYKELKRNIHKRFLLEFYHHDMPSEPTVSTLCKVLDIFHDDSDGEMYINIRFYDGTDVHFKETIYNTNLTNGQVAFGSKQDDETYCLISFH